MFDLYNDIIKLFKKYFHNLFSVSSGLLLVMVLCTLMISATPSIALANSAEPPSLVILINNPPKDLSIELISNENQPKAIANRVGKEGKFVIYSNNMFENIKYKFKISTKGDSFECTLG